MRLQVEVRFYDDFAEHQRFKLVSFVRTVLDRNTIPGLLCSYCWYEVAKIVVDKRVNRQSECNKNIFELFLYQYVSVCWLLFDIKCQVNIYELEALNWTVE